MPPDQAHIVFLVLCIHQDHRYCIMLTASAQAMQPWPGMPCLAIVAPHTAPSLQDGKTIITGWSDGKIRGYGPETGREKFTIHDAHHGSVSALAGTADSARIISGGSDDCHVRVWDIQSKKLLASMTEHQVGQHS